MPDLFLDPKLVPVSEPMPTDPQEIIDLVSQYTGIGGASGFTGINTGSSTPGVTSQDVPWFKTNISGDALGMFYFQGGIWRPERPIGNILHFGHNFTTPPPGYALCNGVGTYFDEALVEHDIPDYTDRVVAGTGNLYSVGDTGGIDGALALSLDLPSDTDNHALTNNELADHSHLYLGSLDIDLGGYQDKFDGPVSGSKGDDSGSHVNDYNRYETVRGGAIATDPGAGDGHSHSITGNATGDIDIRQKFIAAPSIIYIAV